MRSVAATRWTGRARRAGPALGLALVLLAGTSHVAAQTGTAGPTGPPGAPPATSSAIVADVQRQYDSMEQSIEQQYAKLLKSAKDKKAALEDKIKELERRIDALKAQAKKIELVAQKMDQLLPKIQATPGSGPAPSKGARSSAARVDEVAALLSAELAKDGVQASPAEVRWAAEALGDGGPAAGARVSAQAKERIDRVNAAIAASSKDIQLQRAQIQALDQEIAKLEKEREKALAELRTKKQKAIEQAATRQDSAAKPLPPKP
jgi:septal ring factor EnvC (AmiA/AmiB activator)